MFSTSLLWPLVPARLLPAFITALIAFPSAYFLLTRFYHTRKQHSWIPTLLGSGFMTLSSLPFLWDYLSAGASVAAVGHRPWMADSVLAAFMAYLLADLILGAFFYREHVTLAMGWIHHVVYFLIVSVVIDRNLSYIFALAAAMELPTHLLALATLNPQLRSDALFATTFFLLRIVYHITLLVQYSLPSTRRDVLPSESTWLPVGILAAALPMHIVWFHGCVRGILRRRAHKRERAAKAALGVPVSAFPTPSAEKMLSFAPNASLGLDSLPVPVPILMPGPVAPLSPPATPPTRPLDTTTTTSTSTATYLLPRPPSLLSLPSLPLSRQLSKEGRQDAMRRLGEAVSKEGREEAMKRLGAVLGRGKGVVRRVRAEMGFGEQEMERERREVMAY